MSVQMLYSKLQNNLEATLWRNNKLRHGEMSRKVTTQANLKCEDIERNHKAVRKKKRRTQTHTRSLWINFTAAITSNMQPYWKPSLRRQRRKCEEQKHVNLLCPKRIWAAPPRLPRHRFFNSLLPRADVIHHRWQMWHDSSAWEAAATTDRNLLTAQCATRRSLSRQNHIFKTTDASACSRKHALIIKVSALVLFVFTLEFGECSLKPRKDYLILHVRQNCVCFFSL